MSIKTRQLKKDKNVSNMSTQASEMSDVRKVEDFKIERRNGTDLKEFNKSAIAELQRL